MPDPAERLSQLLLNHPQRMHLLGIVSAIALPDCWIGAGFVRSLVWDCLHGRTTSPIDSDVDVVWFDPARAMGALDREIEIRLNLIEPSVKWSVSNQARMHARNGDNAYCSTEDAIKHWPDTAGAVAVRLVGRRIEIIAPYGLSDLFSLTARPTPPFEGEKLSVFHARLQEKRWLQRWPQLVLR
ncbi:MAG: nucleotidyltransferase family protein [Rhodospirillaceae bacterium]